MSGEEHPGSERDESIEDDPLAALRDEFADVDKSAVRLREAARQDAIERAGK